MPFIVDSSFRLQGLPFLCAITNLIPVLSLQHASLRHVVLYFLPDGDAFWHLEIGGVSVISEVILKGISRELYIKNSINPSLTVMGE